MLSWCARRAFVARASIALLATSACVRSRETGPSASESANVPPPPPPVASEPVASATNGTPGPYVRDRAELTVDGAKEIWTLEWTALPKVACVEPAEFTDCSCEAFAFGEEGSLALVRRRLGGTTETLPLDVLFGGRARLLRWTPTDDELRHKKAPPLDQIVTRPVARVLAFDDYNHDGRATEFLLDVGGDKCGHRKTVAIGLDAKNPRLHVFASVEKGDEALVLDGKKAWLEVKAKKGAELLEVECGDPKVTQEERLLVTIDDQGLHASKKKRPCK